MHALCQVYRGKNQSVIVTDRGQHKISLVTKSETTTIDNWTNYWEKIWILARFLVDICVDFRKAYDSVHRESLYSITEEFGIPNKLVSLTKICMEGTKYQVTVDSTLSEAFTVKTSLKQDDSLSPLLFNLALEKAVRLSSWRKWNSYWLTTWYMFWVLRMIWISSVHH